MTDSWLISMDFLRDQVSYKYVWYYKILKIKVNGNKK